MAWLTVGEPGSTHLKETREQRERKNIWGKKKNRGKEVQYIPRTSNIKCVLGIEIMQEEEGFGQHSDSTIIYIAHHSPW